jgi:hypothetical protein
VGEIIAESGGAAVVLSEYDRRVLDAAGPWVDGKRGAWDLLVLHLFENDPIGHALGTEDPAYEAHLRWLDGRITELSARLEKQAPTTFMLVADHGMTAGGTHGGMTAAERQVPLVLWGAGVAPGELAPRPLLDAAPTISAVLGVPPPVGSEGVPAVEALALTPRQAAAVWLDALRQRSQRFKSLSAMLPWLRADPGAAVAGVEALEKAGRFDEAARSAERAVREADRRIEAALPEEWLGRLIVAAWCLVLAAGLSLAWPPQPRARRAAAALGALLFLGAAAPLIRPAWWSWASGLVEAAAAALVAVTVFPGLSGASGLRRAGWAAWALAMAALCWQDLLDVNLWAGLVLAAWLAAKLRDRPSWDSGIAASALALGIWARDWRPDAYLSVVRSALPAAPLPPLAAWQFRLMSAATVGALLWSLKRAAAPGTRGSTARVLAAAALAPVVALALPGGGVHAAWAIGAAAASLAAAAAWCGPRTRGRCVSLAAAGFFTSLATPRQACALLLAVAVGWAASADDESHPLLSGLVLMALSMWSFTISGGRLVHLDITVEEGFRVLGNAWYPRVVVALLGLKYAIGAGAPLLPRLGARPARAAFAALPPLGALAAGFLTSLWWDRFMQGGTLRFTTQVSYVGLVSTVVVGWVIFALWAAARAGRSWAPRALSADPV